MDDAQIEPQVDTGPGDPAPVLWGIDEWRNKLSKPPPSRTYFYEEVKRGLIEIVKLGRASKVATPHEVYVARKRRASKAA